MLASLGPGWEEKREFNVKGMGRRVKQQTPQIVATLSQARHLAHQMQHSTREGQEAARNRESISSLVQTNSACKRANSGMQEGEDREEKKRMGAEARQNALGIWHEISDIMAGSVVCLSLLRGDL
jgi:hypothetical protein